MVIRSSNFFEGLETFPWCREWVKEVLRCLRWKGAISPPDQPLHSLQALEYLDIVGFKIARGMKNIQFEETSDEWSRFLSENTLSSKQKTGKLFQEMSFKRQGMWFTYERLGFSYSDIDEVFDWAGVSDNIRTRDIDDPWMRFEARNT